MIIMYDGPIVQNLVSKFILLVFNSRIFISDAKIRLGTVLFRSRAFNGWTIKKKYTTDY